MDSIRQQYKLINNLKFVYFYFFFYIFIVHVKEIMDLRLQWDP